MTLANYTIFTIQVFLNVIVFKAFDLEKGFLDVKLFGELPELLLLYLAFGLSFVNFVNLLALALNDIHSYWL